MFMQIVAFLSWIALPVGLIVIIVLILVLMGRL